MPFKLSTYICYAEGKLSRKLKALSAGLERDISRVTPVIDSAVTTGSEALALVGTIGGLVADISDGSNRIEKIFKALGTVLKIFIPFPYIGPGERRIVIIIFMFLSFSQNHCATHSQ